MIKVREMRKSVRGKWLLDGIDLHIWRGEVLGLTGDNACGKSLFLKILATAERPSSGAIEVGGIDILKRPREARRLLGYVPESFGLYRHLRIREYLEFFAAAYGIASRERGARIEAVLQAVGLEEEGAGETYVTDLSRGRRQQLSWARALIGRPEVLILDDPLAGLDPRTRQRMKEVLERLKGEGKTAILSSSRLEDFVGPCDRVAILSAGKIARVLAPQMETWEEAL